MEIQEIKSPQDVLDYMKQTIQYGWIDVDGNKHDKDSMAGFRKLYRTMSAEEALSRKMGVCIEQAAIIHYLLDLIHIENKMFCCRIFEPDDYGELEEEEHMHCFCLYYQNDKVFHLEHANSKKKGIYEYDSEEEAIRNIANYYVRLRGGKESPTTEFYKVERGLTYQQFNAYINHQRETTQI